MIRQIAMLGARELVRALATWPARVALVFLAAVSALSATMGLHQFAVRSDHHGHLLQQLVQDQMRTTRLAGAQAEPALRVLRPPTPGSVIIRGLDLVEPAYWDFGPAGALPSGVQELENNESDVGPVIDLEFINRALVALLALVYSIEAVRRVQPGGDLFAVRGLPIAAWQIWTGQLAGAAAFTALASAVSILAVLVSVWFSGSAGTTADVTRQLWKVAPADAVYLAFVLAMGASLASAARRPRVIYFLTVVVWLTMTVLAPPALLTVARLLRPLAPSLVMTSTRNAAFAADIRSGEDALGDALSRFRTAQGGLHNDVDPRFLTAIDEVWMPHARQARRSAEAVERVWTQQEQSQWRLYSWLELVSPGSLHWRAATDAVGVGLANRQAWAAAIDAHQRALNAALFDDRPRVTVRIAADKGHETLAAARRQLPTLASLPEFDAGSLTSPPTPFPRALWLLAGYAVVMLVLGYRRFVKLAYSSSSA